MSICKKCGLELEHGVNKCPNCGEEIEDNSKEETFNNDDKARQEDIQKNKVNCVLCYLGILFFLPLVCDKNSKFGRFHANQALVLFIAGVGVGFILRLLRILLVLSSLGFISTILSSAFGLLTFALMIIGMVNAGHGDMKELLIIGKFELIKA